MESPMRGWLKNLTKLLTLIRYLFTLSPLVQVTKLIFLPKDVVYRKVPRSIPPGGMTFSLLGLSLGWKIPFPPGEF
jgi:hypothetical protein